VQADTKYAKSGDLSIAYQVIGDGPLDVVIVPGIISHVEFFHELPGYTAFLERLGRFARVITFDKRGSGLSDRPDRVGTLEERIDDMRAVMDAAGSERAAIVGWSEGGPMSILYAATHPDRVSHLVLCGSFACYVGDALHGEVMVPELFEPFLEHIVGQWGDGGFCRVLAPSATHLPDADVTFARIERYSASPQTIRRLWEAVREIDVRPVLPSVRVPTLVLRREGEVMPSPPSQWIADHIPGARYVELPGSDHVPWIGDAGPYLAELEEFLTGHVAPLDEDDDRVLATVLFTDVVGSTARAAKEGDARWRTTLDRFQDTVRREVVRHRGHEVNTRGDDFLIRFDGPARAIRCARAISEGARPLGIEVRSGIHTGEIELRGDDVAGLTVHIGARVASLADPGEVLATTTVRDLVVGSGLRFEDRGEHDLKGVPGRWRLVSVRG
jgi:pimeloyl-ACP methyl ester carboxylesterase/class 3 adenylate cyclase